MTSRRLVVLISLMVVSTAGLVGVAGSSQAAGPVNPTLTAPADQTAVKVNDTIGLGGTVGSGATQGRVQDAKLLFFRANGSQYHMESVTDGFSVSGTELNPQAWSLGANELPTDVANNGWIIFEVTVQFADGNATGQSAPMPIDLQDPVLQSATTRSVTEIEVLFSEDVVHPQGDSGSDWKVTDTFTQQAFPVSAVTQPAPNRRNLILSQPMGDDTAPLVEFLRIPGNPGARQAYLDRAHRSLAVNDAERGCRCVVADDFIPPAAPFIQGVDDENNRSGVGNDTTPDVSVSNLRPENVAEIYLEKGGAGWSPEDALIGTAGADALGNATVTICTNGRPRQGEPSTFCDKIGEDETHTLYAIARDPSGNHSTVVPEGTATYRLDRQPPVPILVGTNGKTVDVVFSEAIFGAGANVPSNWTIQQADGNAVLSVSGADGSDRRVLTAAKDVPADPPNGPALVRWLGSSDTTDQAGNLLETFQRNAQNRLAPFARITKPEGKVWTAAEVYTITGTTGNEASTVRVFRDDNDDDIADDPNSPVATAPVSGDAFSVQVNLRTGPAEENDFVVQPVRTSPSTLTGSYANVPTIIQDNADPVVSVTQPVAGDGFAGGSTQTIKWDAEDPGSPSFGAGAAVAVASLGAGSITIEYSLDGGTMWHEALRPDGTKSGPQSNQFPREFQWLVPDEENSTAALIRVTAEDEAKRRGSGLSGTFSIDVDNPFFSAVTKDATHVLVQFSEPVSGLVTSPEWTIDGTPARSTSPSGQVIGITELTLESLNPIGKSDTPEIVYGKVAPPTQLRDHVGNTMSPSSTKANDGIPPGVPTVTDPVTEVFTGQEKQSIKGGAEEGSLVTVYRDEGNDGTPDVEVGSQQLGPTETLYDVEATLQDGVNELLVVASDPAGNDSPGANVPTITADLVAPVVTIVEPNAGQLVGGGDQQFTVRWIAVDANLVQDSILIELSTDGGASYETIAQNEMNDGEFSFPIANEAVKSAMIRVSARDEYDRVGTATSGAFEILVCEIFGTNGDDVLVGTDKGETICSYDGNDTVHGRGGNDTILSGSGRKKIDAGDGNDRVEGGSADDLIRGGSGDDDLNGQDGNDQVLGDDGKDIVIGFNGNDSLRGGTGNDRLLGQAGNDRLTGDSGNDTLSGAEGNDKARGGTGNDSLLGEAGNDQLRGDAGNDRVKGGDGNDRLIGGADDDRLDGMDGRDNLSGGSGNDRLAGGPGKDRCKPGSGANHVTRSC